ncbi:uncharacterized protein C8A04DRAFT_40235 [Dichotomopilus funicola]|uniref:HCNGP-like protein n=1 Tax=Dichotomopilus funicola TaxID=1934379 RepID=A0AAN6UW43_9PEZI|nr:hypothetical protein C8A04DRAFT_40235 [Dichotomopilus funicola]
MGLVQYDSSDEEEDVQSPVETQASKPTVKPTPVIPQNSSEPAPPSAAPPSTTEQTKQPSPAPPQPTNPSLGPVLGPTLGPSRPPPSSTTTTHPTLPEPEEEDDGQTQVDLSFLDPQSSTTTNPNPNDPPQSPHTRTRTLLHNLTLPSVADMDIPPSPPGTPPPGLDALTAKFETFLRLKRTKGVHFNERLAQNKGMANPGVGDKLLAFVGIGTEVDDGYGGDGISTSERQNGGAGAGGSGGGGLVDQYATVLSADVWDPTCFPAWSYRGALRRTQERVAKERERAKGEPVAFVSSSSGGGVTGGGGLGSVGGSRSGTPGVGAGTGKRKGRWDT